MRVLVTGANGQLGREFCKQGQEHELVVADREILDVTDVQATSLFLQRVKPEVVIHCAAYTQVDAAETDVDRAFSVNALGARNLAASCLETGARMVYLSTDYVFDGIKGAPYREYDTTNPQTVYGWTKWQGEEFVRQILGRHYILRTAWLYGDGHNFVRTMLKLADVQPSLRIVHDQTGTPTSTVDLVWAIFRLLGTDAYGTYHATCQGQCSWYELACEIFRQQHKDVEVIPVDSTEFVRPARRPAYSVLDNYMLRLSVEDPMREWREALAEYLLQVTK